MHFLFRHFLFFLKKPNLQSVEYFERLQQNKLKEEIQEIYRKFLYTTNEEI